MRRIAGYVAIVLGCFLIGLIIIASFANAASQNWGHGNYSYATPLLVDLLISIGVATVVFLAIYALDEQDDR